MVPAINQNCMDPSLRPQILPVPRRRPCFNPSNPMSYYMGIAFIRKNIMD